MSDSSMSVSIVCPTCDGARMFRAVMELLSGSEREAHRNYLGWEIAGNALRFEVTEDLGLLSGAEFAETRCLPCVDPLVIWGTGFYAMMGGGFMEILSPCWPVQKKVVGSLADPELLAADGLAICHAKAFGAVWDRHRYCSHSDIFVLGDRVAARYRHCEGEGGVDESPRRSVKLSLWQARHCVRDEWLFMPEGDLPAFVAESFQLLEPSAAA